MAGVGKRDDAQYYGDFTVISAICLFTASAYEFDGNVAAGLSLLTAYTYARLKLGSRKVSAYGNLYIVLSTAILTVLFMESLEAEDLYLQSIWGGLSLLFSIFFVFASSPLSSRAFRMTRWKARRSIAARECFKALFPVALLVISFIAIFGIIAGIGAFVKISVLYFFLLASLSSRIYLSEFLVSTFWALRKKIDRQFP